MKNKISKILGVALSISVLMSLLVVGSPAKAGTVAYTTETLPSGITYVVQTPATALPGGGLLDYAIASDGTIYAVAGTSHVYKSTNNGSSWSRVDTSVATAGNVTWELVAVAPDNSSVVAVGDQGTPAVWVSTNGAATGGADSWSNTGAVGTLAAGAAGFRDLAISPAVSGVREIIAAGTKAAAPGIFALNLGGTVATWTDTWAAPFLHTNPVTSGTLLGANATTSIYSVAFSPAYISDRVLVVLSGDAAGGGFNFLNILRFTTATSGTWNVAAGFTDYTGVGAVGANNGKINAGPGAALTGATLSLAPTYSGLDSASRVAFVSIDSGAAATSGVIRMNDAVAKLISVAEQYSSVAFNGTNLVAGRAVDNVVMRSTDPLSSTPTLTATILQQRPSGGLLGVGAPTTTRVAWHGTNVVATTLGNESAFARSIDGGVTFNDVSQISTVAVNILDVAVAPDGSKLYMVTDDTADVSVWTRIGTTWERIMSIPAPTSLQFSLRIAPNNKDVVYLVQNGSTNILYSNDGGQANWATRITNEAVTDLAVESADVLYYVNAANIIRKSSNAGFIWSDPAVAPFTAGAPTSVRSLGANLVLVTGTGTGTNGQVAYSTNGATTFTRVTLTSGGAIHATGTTLASGSYIYAVPGAGHGLGLATTTVYRYTVGSTGEAAVWTALEAGGVAAASVFTGIALQGEVLYAYANDPLLGSTLWRTLNPTASASVAGSSVAFSKMVTTPAGALGPPDFTAFAAGTGRPSNLNVSVASGVTTIWAIDNDAAAGEEAAAATDTINDELYVFTDALASPATTTGPTSTGGIVDVNPVSGAVFSITLTWNRPSQATGYNIQIALDDKFNTVVAQDGAGLGLGIATPFVPGDVNVSPVALTVAPGIINTGTKYYWRVRAAAPVQSPWSATASFETKSLAKPFALAGPAVGATGVVTKPVLTWTAYTGAKWYEVTLSEDPTFAIPEWSHNVNGLVYGVTETLKYGTTYYWRVRGVTADPYVKGTAVITPAGPWEVGAFTTMVEPVAPKAEQVIVVQKEPAPAPQIVTVEKEVLVPQSIPDWMLLTIIIIGAVLVIALIVLIVRTRRVA